MLHAFSHSHCFSIELILFLVYPLLFVICLSVGMSNECNVNRFFNILQSLKRERVLRIFKLNSGQDDHAIMFTDDYINQVGSLYLNSHLRSDLVTDPYILTNYAHTYKHRIRSRSLKLISQDHSSSSLDD